MEVQLLKEWTLMKVLGTPNLFRVVEPFVWEVDNQLILIPTWFETNFGSIPRILTFIFIPTKYLVYILHDFLYTYHHMSRINADRVMRLWILDEGGYRIEAYFIYLWVRIGWWGIYSLYTNTKIKWASNQYQQHK